MVTILHSSFKANVRGLLKIHTGYVSLNNANLCRCSFVIFITDPQSQLFIFVVSPCPQYTVFFYRQAMFIFMLLVMLFVLLLDLLVSHAVMRKMNKTNDTLNNIFSWYSSFISVYYMLIIIIFCDNKKKQRHYVSTGVKRSNVLR